MMKKVFIVLAAALTMGSVNAIAAPAITADAPSTYAPASDSVDDMLNEYDISYIKWDMNRAYSQTGAENLENPQELWYRHIKAVYDIADRLKEKHPGLQIECCASGGGRADLGALSHFDMVCFLKAVAVAADVLTPVCFIICLRCGQATIQIPLTVLPFRMASLLSIPQSQCVPG